MARFGGELPVRFRTEDGRTLQSRVELSSAWRMVERVSVGRERRRMTFFNIVLLDSSLMHIRRRFIISARIAALGATLLGTLPSAARSDGVPTPVDDQPGLVIEYERAPPTSGRPQSETWIKRGDFIRVDTSSAPVPWRPLIQSSSYHRLGQQSVLSIGRYLDGSLALLSVRHDALSHPPSPTERTFLGVSETHLGQMCRTWSRSVPLPSGYTFDQSGCVTDNGVELWWRNANVDAITATSIAEAAVRLEDIEPPLDLLDFRNWIAAVPSGDHKNDFDIVLSSTDPAAPTTFLRRSGDWVLEQEQSQSGVTTGVVVINRYVDINFRYSTNIAGDAQLSITRNLHGITSEAIAAQRERLTELADETVLGERCQWWNMSKNVFDHSRSECQTQDGAVLIVRTISWGSQRSWTATKLERGPMAIESILPPPDIKLPATWGFSNR